jgi:DNA-binding NarL/FixJ family response regulator
MTDRANEESPTRVWIDEHNAIFRRGLASCIAAGGMTVVGESSGFLPEPAADRFDILLFDVDAAGLGMAARIAAGNPIRLVGIATAGSEEVLFDAVEAGLAGFLLRAELTPESLVSCLRTVAAGVGAMPPSLLARLVGALARGAPRGATPGQLARRELDVLRLLAEGGETRDIAARLSYSERTVKNIVHDVLTKMNCRSRAQAVALATRQGVI